MAKLALLYCPCCGGGAEFERLSGAYFPVKAACTTKTCGVQTPFVRSEAIAAAIWNKRLERKPPKRAKCKGRTDPERNEGSLHPQYNEPQGPFR